MPTPIYRLSCLSSTTTDITRSAPGSTSGSIGGTANLQITDTSTTPPTVVSSPSVPNSGNISENGEVVYAGSRSGFEIDVTWNTDGSTTGTASGLYGGSYLGCSVPVSVDGAGVRRRKPKGLLKPAARRMPAAKIKRAPKRKAALKRKPAPARKRASSRRTAGSRR